MRPRPCALLAVGGISAVLAASAHPAGAEGQEPAAEPRPHISEEDSPAWSGSRYGAPLGEGTHRTPDPQVVATGEFRFMRDRDVRVTVTIEPSDPRPETCAHEDTPQLPTTQRELDPPSNDRIRYLFEAPAVELPCNGRYAVTARAHVYAPDVPEPAASSPDLVAHLHLAAPSPDVTGVRLESRQSEVVVRWDPVAQPPPDFRGYRVERSVQGNPPTSIASVGTDVTEAVDAAPPDPRAGTTYRVFSLRDGPGGELLTSTAPAEATVDAPSGGAPSSAPIAPDGGARLPAAPGQRVAPPPHASSPQPAPALGGRPGGPAEVDEGYDDELPYGDREPGETEPVLPQDAALLYGGGTSGEELLTPIAIALLLAVWAAHLRYVARLAGPPR